MILSMTGEHHLSDSVPVKFTDVLTATTAVVAATTALITATHTQTQGYMILAEVTDSNNGIKTKQHGVSE